MIVEVNTSILERNNLTANQYILLFFLFNALKGGFELFYNKYQLKGELEELMDRDYLLKGDIPEPMDSDRLVINKKTCNALFIGENDMFWEFYSTYPLKVHAGRGISSYRFLRAGSTDAQVTLNAKKKYEKIIKGSRAIHEHIMQCLHMELWLRKKDNSMSYMVEVARYLNEKLWQKYESVLDMAKERVNKEKYGEKLI